MSRAHKESAIHMLLIMIIQWTSLAVIILNATALYSLKSSEKSTQGLVSQQGGLIDYILVVLGSSSFIIATSFLFYHLHLYLQKINEPHQGFSPPRTSSAVEIIFSVVFIVVWTAVVSLILTYSKDSSSHCKFYDDVDNPTRNDVCKLFDTTMILAFTVIGSWALVLLAMLFFLIRSPLPPTTIFTIQAPHQTPTIITTSTPSITSQPSRSFYLNQQSNKINPTSVDEGLCIDSFAYDSQIISPKSSSLKLLMSSRASEEGHLSKLPSFYINGDNSRFAQSSMLYQPCSKSPSSLSIEIFNHNNQKMMPPSLNSTNSPSQNSRTDTPESSVISSSVSPEIVSINLDTLPVIQVGTLSHIDISFLAQLSQE
ncbi:hypothetical protein A0J61_02295 [Choanephora cucurbitarum]|uniref:Uncharacterized protein n=1 Tax=Choanephora cucurbitarum TaxID=101091 RepID=A0A1C7NKK9_9FUNG|nr:hypothetical protein A0J61_02295 [Choanephora cucurbitarum]